MERVLARKEISLGILLLTALITTAGYMTPGLGPIVPVSNTLNEWVTILANFAIYFGSITLLLFHSRKIMKREPGQWPYSVYMIAVFSITILLSLVSGGTTNDPYYGFYMNIYTPLDTAVYAYLGFFVCSAAYRAFRAKSVESSIMLVVGLLMMLLNTSVGPVIWSGFPVIGNWILDVPNFGAARAFAIVLSCGTIIMALRVLSGKEKAITGGK